MAIFIIDRCAVVWSNEKKKCQKTVRATVFPTAAADPQATAQTKEDSEDSVRGKNGNYVSASLAKVELSEVGAVTPEETDNDSVRWNADMLCQVCAAKVFHSPSSEPLIL